LNDVASNIRQALKAGMPENVQGLAIAAAPKAPIAPAAAAPANGAAAAPKKDKTKK
jgi:hypothetical protein